MVEGAIIAMWRKFEPAIHESMAESVDFLEPARESRLVITSRDIRELRVSTEESLFPD